MKKIKKTDEEVDKILKEHGLIRYEDSIYKGVNIKLKCIDKEGYIVFPTISTLITKKSIPSRFGNGNIETLYNIQHYIELQNLNIKLKDGQKFSSTTQKLIFICKIYGEFKKSWQLFQLGHYCPICSGSNHEVHDGNRLSINRPELIKYFVNIKDAHSYSVNHYRLRSDSFA